MINFTFISAWNDSGGGFLNRLFDGHPAYYVWPYELQLGTHVLRDKFSSWFKAKYRWPEFASGQSPAQVFDAIIDDELKSALTLQSQSKHAGYQIAVSLDDWKTLFVSQLSKNPTRAEIIQTYLESLMTLLDPHHNPTTATTEMLAHCPVLIMDADKIWADFPQSRIVHIIRDPRCSFVDFNHRNPTVAVDEYMNKWTVVNRLAYTYHQKYADKVYITSLRQLVEDRRDTISQICAWLGVDFASCLMQPSWQGEPLTEASMGPFGGVPTVTWQAEQDRIGSLTQAQLTCIEQYTEIEIKLFRDAGVDFTY